MIKILWGTAYCALLDRMTFLTNTCMQLSAELEKSRRNDTPRDTETGRFISREEVQ